MSKVAHWRGAAKPSLMPVPIPASTQSSISCTLPLSVCAPQMYFIRTGFVDVHCDGRLVDTLGEGHHFGELALLQVSAAPEVRQRRDAQGWCRQPILKFRS